MFAYVRDASGTIASRWLVFSLVALALVATAHADETQPAKRPNILWLTCEDMSPNLGCFGDKLARTPNLDRLAAEGVRYSLAFSTSGVCAPSRSCLITGVYPSSLGTQFMRCKGTLPDFVRCYPEYLRDAGYRCTNNVKTDYNFDPKTPPWNESSRTAHWRGRKPGQPFFAVFNDEVTHESKCRLRGEEFEKLVSRLPRNQRTDPAKVTLPPYYADTPEARQDWANYLDTIAVMDLAAGDRLAQLEADGLADDTIVFFYSDHGVGLPRAKRWLYESGTHVPLIIRFGKNFLHLAPVAPGEATDRLVSFVDFAPTVLSLAGIPIPKHMQGVPFLGTQAGPPREYVFGIRDRMDETVDVIRSVRDRKYRYIRNDMPFVTYAQWLEYAEEGNTLHSMRRLLAEGKLSGPPAVFFQPTKPAEELYDVEADPHEIRNLAGSADHRAILKRLRGQHDKWQTETLDLGLIPEPDLHSRCGKRAPYDVVRGENNPFPLERIRAAALIAQQGTASLDEMTALLADNDPAVRYWGATGLAASAKDGSRAQPALIRHLSDESGSVRVAAARALLLMGENGPALSRLTRDLADENEWVRHRAALALGELGPRAASARAQLETASKDTNDYTMRAARRALQLLDAK